MTGRPEPCHEAHMISFAGCSCAAASGARAGAPLRREDRQGGGVCMLNMVGEVQAVM